MSQHRNTTGIAYPGHYLRKISPLLLDIPRLASTQILFKCLLYIADCTHGHQMLSKVGSPYLAARGKILGASQTVVKTQTTEPLGNFLRPLLARLRLLLHALLNCRAGQVQIKANNMYAKLVPVTGKLYTWDQPEICTGRPRGLVGLDAVVIGNRQHINIALYRERNKLGGRQVAVGNIGVAVQIYIHRRKNLK